MIKIEDFGKKIQINGYPEQVALEFEMLARQVRETFCKYLGEELGDEYYKEILKNALKTEAEVDAEAEELIRKKPELMKALEKLPIAKKIEEACKD